MIKKQETLNKLYSLAKQLSKKYSYDLWNEMWDICCDYNRNNPDYEIFMCEDEDESGTFIYYIEDDYFYLAD